MTEPPRETVPRPHRERRIGARQVIGIVLIILLVIFLVENTRKVKIRFIGPEFEAPLLLALLVSAVLGALATLIVQRRRRR